MIPHLVFFRYRFLINGVFFNGLDFYSCLAMIQELKKATQRYFVLSVVWRKDDLHRMHQNF